MKIELTQEQTDKFKKWKKTFNNLPDIGATEGHFGIEVIFTSIGDIILGKSWDGRSIDLTDYSNF